MLLTIYPLLAQRSAVPLIALYSLDVLVDGLLVDTLSSLFWRAV